MGIWGVRLFLILVAAAIILFNIWRRYKRLVQLGSKIPGIRIWRLNTDPIRIPKDGPHIGLLGFLMNLVKYYDNSPCKVWLFHELCVVITKPKEIEAVLGNVRLFSKAQHYGVMKPVMGQGLFTADDLRLWRVHRKLITPTLHFTILKDFIPIFFKQAVKLAGKVKSKDRADVFSVVGLCTLDAICNTAMGVNVYAQESNESPFLQDYSTILKSWNVRMTKPWLMMDFLFSMSNFKKMHDKAAERMKSFTDLILQSKKGTINKGNAQTVKQDYGPVRFQENSQEIKRSKAFLDLMLSSDCLESISDEELKEETITLIMAGQETTATVNSFALTMLAYHQDVQRKVQEELDSIFKDRDNDCPTFEDLQKMAYIERVIKEVLRLFPALPLIGRKLEEEIRVGDYTLPAGCSVGIFLYATHRDPDIFPSPNTFNPDNFLPEKCLKRENYSYIPFGAGIRNCIGQKYAMLQMKTILSTLLKRFRVSPGDGSPNLDDLQVMMASSLKTRRKIFLSFTPRT